MLRPLSRHVQVKPAQGQIVRDGSGTRYQVLQVGLKYLSVSTILADGELEKGSRLVKVSDVIIEAPPTAVDPVDEPPKW